MIKNDKMNVSFFEFWFVDIFYLDIHSFNVYKKVTKFDIHLYGLIFLMPDGVSLDFFTLVVNGLAVCVCLYVCLDV